MKFLLRLCLLVAATLLLPRWGQAQARPLSPDDARTEPDQEMDLYGTPQYNTIHYITPAIRGVVAVDNVVYWVSPNGRQLTAYRNGHHKWTTDVVAPFKSDLPAASIQTLTLSTGYVFVSLGLRGVAAVDRRNGRVTSKYLD